MNNEDGNLLEVVVAGGGALVLIACLIFGGPWLIALIVKVGTMAGLWYTDYVHWVYLSVLRW